MKNDREKVSEIDCFYFVFAPLIFPCARWPIAPAHFGHNKFFAARALVQLQSQVTIGGTRQYDELIDEKCRQLNKSGTSHDSALHLAQWMKGQFDESVNTISLQ